MKHRLAAVAFSLAIMVVAVSPLLSGCSSQRPIGRCTYGGAAIGGVLGGTAGSLLGYYTSRKDGYHMMAAGLGTGLASGALLGGIAGHYLCDPIVTPPPPPQVVAQAPPPLPPPALPAPAPAAPAPPPVKEKLVLRGVHFDFNKADIRPDDEPVLDEAAETLKSHADVTINVNGYCDSVGADDYNQKLSERRAAAVAKYLADKGVSESRLVPRGFGKANFVATNDTADGRAENRRVELIPAQ